MDAVQGAREHPFILALAMILVFILAWRALENGYDIEVFLLPAAAIIGGLAGYNQDRIRKAKSSEDQESQ